MRFRGGAVRRFEIGGSVLGGQEAEANVTHSMLHAIDQHPTRVLSLSPENDDELANAPAILSFHAKLNHFTAAASMNAFIPADMFPCRSDTRR